MKDKAPIKPGLKQSNYSFDFEDHEYKYIIQHPTFEQLAAALTEATRTGKTDVLAGGKTIWELCCVSYDEKIDENARILVSICADLFENYVMTVDIDIKKN